MNANWVARKKAEHEVRRKETLRNLVTFAEAEIDIMNHKGGDEEMAASSGMLRHLRGEMTDIKDIASRLLGGEGTDADEIRLTAILDALSFVMHHDEFLDGEDGDSGDGTTDDPAGTMQARFETACGNLDEIRWLVVPSYDGLGYDRYLDETIDLPRGNYVVTDPCYLLGPDDDYADLEAELSVFRMRDTLYGDWGCTLYEVTGNGSGEKVGEFCADAGLVCVADWDEVVARNPEVASWPEERPWTMAIVRDFEGTATFGVTEDWFLWQASKPHQVDYRLGHDFELRVILDGTHPATGRHARYVGCQTSL